MPAPTIGRTASTARASSSTGCRSPASSCATSKTRMDEVIADLLQNGITEEELARAKRSAIAQAIYSLDNQATLANIVGQALAVGQTLEQRAELAGARAGGDGRRGAGGRAEISAARGLGHRLSRAAGREEKLMRVALPTPRPRDRAWSPHDRRLRQPRPRGPPRSRRSPARPASRPGWWRTTPSRSSP